MGCTTARRVNGTARPLWTLRRCSQTATKLLKRSPADFHYLWEDTCRTMTDDKPNIKIEDEEEAREIIEHLGEIMTEHWNELVKEDREHLEEVVERAIPEEDQREDDSE